jgi:CheY-like chemotaxis protein
MSRIPGKPAASVGRILVVEDSPSARRLMQDVLLRLGASLPTLRVAGNVVEALTLFTDWKPDVVFVDIELNRDPTSPPPGDRPVRSEHDPKDGIELAVLLLARNPRVQVIICSAADPSDPRVARILTEGRTYFITKPVLAGRVEEVLLRLPPLSAPRRS